MIVQFRAIAPQREYPASPGKSFCEKSYRCANLLREYPAEVSLNTLILLRFYSLLF